MKKIEYLGAKRCILKMACPISAVCKGKGIQKQPKLNHNPSDPKCSEKVWIDFTNNGKTPGVRFSNEPTTGNIYVSYGTSEHFDSRIIFEMMMQKEVIKNIQIWKGLEAWARIILAEKK